MPIFLKDSFSTSTAGSLLTTHAGEIGQTWSQPTGTLYTANTAVLKLNGSGGVYSTTQNTDGYLASSGTPTESDWSLESDVQIFSTQTSLEMGIVAQAQSNIASHYLLKVDMNGSQMVFGKITNNAGATSTLWATAGVAVGNTYHLKIQKTGTTIVFTVGAFTLATITDATPYTGGTFGIWGQSSMDGATTGGVIKNILGQTPTAAASAVILSGPTTGSVNVASGPYTVVANGTLSQSVIVTPSDSSGGTMSPATVTLTAGTTSGTFTYTPTAPANKSLSITNNFSLANIGSPIPVSVPSIYTLPDSRVYAAGFKVLSDRITTSHIGHQLKFSILNSVSLGVTLDVSVLGTNNNYIVRAVIDGVLQTAVSIGSTASTYTLASGLSLAQHTVRIELTTMNNNANRWTDLTNVLQFKSILIGSGGTLLGYTPLSKKAIWLTDSIGEYDSASPEDTFKCFPALISRAQGWEWEQYSFSGNGYNAQLTAPNPVVYSSATGTGSINNWDSTSSRLVNGKLTADYLIIAEGTNDGGGAGLQSSVTTTLTYARTIFSGQIYVVLPPTNDSPRASLLAAYQAYALTDTLFTIINVGTAASKAYPTSDGVHLTDASQLTFSNDIMALLPQAQIGNVITFSTFEHTVTLRMPSQELVIRHLSDLQIASLRQSVPASEEATDTTGLPPIISN